MKNRRLSLKCVFIANILKSILLNEHLENDSENMNNVESKKLFSWFTSNNHILLLTDIGRELNRYLYGEDSCKFLWILL